MKGLTTDYSLTIHCQISTTTDSCAVYASYIPPRQHKKRQLLTERPLLFQSSKMLHIMRHFPEQTNYTGWMLFLMPRMTHIRARGTEQIIVALLPQLVHVVLQKRLLSLLVLYFY